MGDSSNFENRAINTIRFLSADAVQTANSGHPGLPMGAATMAYTLWTRHLRHSPKNPKWPGRDRFVLSGGHGSMLLYSLLYLTGYDLNLNDIKNFRQWGSITPGHPEYGLTPGVETTTGPLGQGFGNGVGMAIAAEHLAAEFNQPGIDIFDQYVFAIVTDGDLMEGISSEAASLAGHLKLGRIIYLYDDNHISIDGSTELAFTEDRAARFEAYNWQVLYVGDGNDVDQVDKAIFKAKEDERPSLIICRTVIGYGLPTRQGTAKAHGEPPGDDELDGAKERLNWPIEPRFYVPDDVLNYYRRAINRGKSLEQEWNLKVEEYQNRYPNLGSDLKRRLSGELPKNWDYELPVFPADEKGIATRASSGKVLNALAKNMPEIIGGSADLTPSNKTWIDNSPSFQKITPEGRNFHFGVREHAMGAIVNGMALFGGVIPYGGTFLVFSDYMRPAIRLSALSKFPSIWVFTHDSIGVGEDGPTHQPVEHLAALRAIPDLVVIRPADGNEVREAWKVAIKRRHAPTALIFSRQNLPTLDRDKFSSETGLHHGAYVLADLGQGERKILLMASGSEVSLIVKAGQILSNEGVKVRLVSFPSWELFEQENEEYRNLVLPNDFRLRLAVEAGISQGWERWVGDKGSIISVNKYGASAPHARIFQEYGFTVDNVTRIARIMIAGGQG